jgi:translation elongation factor P/translation initiation factor 5A
MRESVRVDSTTLEANTANVDPPVVTRRTASYLNSSDNPHQFRGSSSFVRFNAQISFGEHSVAPLPESETPELS